MRENYFLSKYRFIWAFFVIFFAMFFSTQVVAQNSSKTLVKIIENSHSKLRIQINPGDFVAETVYSDKTNFVRIAVDGLGVSTAAGCPELPQYQTLINIPVCDGMTYRVIKTNEVTMPLHSSGFPMMPAQPSRSKSDKSPVVHVKNNLVYQQNSFWSPEIKVEKLGVMRNSTIARLAVSPFSYNPVTGRIKKVTSMEIEITFINPNVQATEELFSKYDDVYADGIQSTMLNKPVVSESKDNFTKGPLHYVIVSSPLFQAAIQPLVAWKKKKGYIVTEAYTNNPSVGSTTNTIKAYLKGLYDNATGALPAPTFVLFVGDIAQIPAFSGTSTNPQNSNVTDLYYCEWTDDYLPECYYGRFSGTTAQEITNQVSKTVEYEKYLMADPSFLNKMVIIAGKDASHETLWGDGQLNYAKSYFNAVPSLTTYSYPSIISGSSVTDIISKVNAGVSIANYSAHGTWDGWSDPAFKVTDVASMSNSGKYAVMIGNCCLSNKFDESACFGESLLRGQNKGAIGYIGGSNNTYWDEDYYFACGYKTIVLNATYDAANLGFYDRLFHTHGESYADQYITTGQMLRAGNMAVTQSNSDYTKYYWEVYHLMGDPSLMPYLGVPTTMTPTYNGVLPLNSSTLAVNTGVPYSYVAVSMDSTLLGATFANATGTANVPLAGVLTSGTADVVVTAQNKQPFFGTITVQTPTGPFVSMITEVVVDSIGNNNGMIDYNETAGLSVTLKNIGIATANSVQAKLTTSSPYITMTDSLETYGNMTVDLSVLKTDAFGFQVSDSVPDGTLVVFDLTITDDAANTWTSTITKTINAPAFEIYTMSINDVAGNNNQRFDAGETVDITFTGKNTGHSIATNVTAMLASNTPGINVINGTTNIGDVGINEKAIATIQVQIADTMSNQTVVHLVYRIDKGVYSVEKIFTPTIGLVKEDYETGDFTRYLWNSNGGDLPWTVVSTDKYEGTYCSKSGEIGDSQTSVMQVTMNVVSNDTISFYRKVSSEGNYDYLRFFIDENEEGKWSGEQAWQRFAYPVTAGVHTFKWTYSKDNMYSPGLDAAWVDYILFPPVAPISVETRVKEINNVVLFPNPTSNNLNIAYHLNDNQNVTIQIFDYNGRLLNTVTENEMQLQGTNTATLNTSSYSSGIYFVMIKTDKTLMTKRFSVVK